MSNRHLAVIASLSAAFLIGGIVFAISAGTPLDRSASGNPLSRRDDFIDKLDRFDSAETFSRGSAEFASVSNGAVSLTDSRDADFRRGVWISPVVEADFPFVELIPSYNAIVPPNTGIRVHVRSRDAASAEWSPWLYYGQWGRTIVADNDDRPRSNFSGGRVAVDVLQLRRPAAAYQVRVALQCLSADAKSMPSLRRVAISYSGPSRDNAQRQANQRVQFAGRWDRSLAVPFVPQGDAPKPLSGEVCSPTSVTMVCSFFGATRPLTENALAIYDDENRIFGNWNRAVQRAGELGLDAWITRFRTWDQVKAQIAAGVPVIASIRFEKGAMPNNPIYQDTDGHIIVIRGFTPEGDVIVNDPASRDKGNGVVYKSDELAAAWFGAGGVGYIIRSRNISTAMTTN